MADTVSQLVLKILGDSSSAVKAAAEASGALGGLSDATKGPGEAAQSLGGILQEVFTNPIQAVEDLTQKIGTGLTSALAELGPVAGVAGGALAVAAGAVAAVGATVFALADKAANAGEAQLEFSRKTGIAVENVGALQFAATAAGGSLDSLTGILRMVEMRSQATGAAGDKFSGALKDIGINAAAFNKMDNESKIMALSAGFQKGAASGNTMADAMLIMGRAGVSNLALLDKMNPALLELGQRLGVTFTPAQAKQAEDFKLQLGVVETALGNIATKIGIAVLPAVEQFIEGIAQSPTFVQKVTDAVIMLTHGLGYLVEGAGYVATMFGKLTKDVLIPVATDIEMVAGAVAWAIDKIAIIALESVQKMVEHAKTVGPLLNAVVPGIGAAIDIVASKQDTLNASVNWFKKDAAGAFDISGLKTAYKTVGTVTDDVYNATQSLGKALIGVTVAGGTATAGQQAHNQVMTEGAAAGQKLEQAIQKITDTILGDSVQVEANKRALDGLAQSKTLDQTQTEALYAAIEKLKKAHQELTPAMLAFIAAHKDASPEVVKLKDAIETLHDKITSLQATGMSWSQIMQLLGKDAEKLSTDAREQGESLDNLDTVVSAVADQFSILSKISKDPLTDFQKALKPFEDKTLVKQWGDTLKEMDGLDKQLMTDLQANALAAADYQIEQLKAVGASQNEIRDAERNREILSYQQKIDNINAVRDQAIKSAREAGTYTETVARQIDAVWTASMGGAEEAHRLAFLKMDAQVQTWESSVLAVANDFKSLAQVAGGSISTIVQGIGTAVQSVGMLGDSLKQINTATSGEGGTDWVGLASGITGVVGSVISIGKAIFSGLFGQAGRDMVVKYAQQMGGFDALHAQLIATLGGSAADQLWQQMGAVGHKNTAQAQAWIDGVNAALKTAADNSKTLSDALNNSASAAGTLWNDQLRQLVASSKEAGLNLDTINQLLGKQMANVGAGLGQALGVTASAYDTLAKDQQALTTASGAQIDTLKADIKVQQQIVDATKISSQQGASAVASAIQGTIDSAVAGGQSFVDAVKAQAPAIAELARQMTASGYSGGAAFDFIQKEAKLATDQVAGPALTALQGYSDAVVGLSNAGQLTQDSFAGLEGQIGSTDAALIAQGQDGDAVMAGMQGELQTAWELEQKFGFKADDATQALIDQAAAAGVVGEEHKTATQQMIDALNHMAQTLDKVAQKFTGPGGLADSAANAARSIQGSLDGITAPDLTIGVGFATSGGPPDMSGASLGPGPDVPVMDAPIQSVTAPGLVYVKPGDIVGMPSRSGGMGTTVNFTAQISTVDTDGVRRAMPMLIDQLKRAVQYNDYGLRSHLRVQVNPNNYLPSPAVAG